MKSAGLQNSMPAAPPAANGAHRRSRKTGAGKGTNGAEFRAEARQSQEAMDAPFAVTEAAPVDAPMWPLNPAMWFQAELAAAIPSWTGLSIERGRMPAPDFECSQAAAFDLPAAPEPPRQMLVPAPGARIPASDLATFGWDPRTICRKEESE
jgi:hypothetical protein